MNAKKIIAIPDCTKMNSMDSKKQITIVGSSNMDLTAISPRIPAVGETILGYDFFMTPGGKGANQAVAAAKLGGNVFFVAKLGDDLYGSKSLSNFKKAGINTDYISNTKDAPSGVALINVDQEGNNSIVVIPGANHKLSMLDVKSAESVISQSKAVVCQLEIPLDVVEGTALLARKHKVPFILDPAPAPRETLSEKLLSCVDILTPNETEAEQISGIKIVDDDSAAQACNYLLGLGVKTVILTMGEKGLLFATQNQQTFIPRIEVEAVDSTAAGDAFTGALAYYIVQGNPIFQATVLANQVAALSVTKKGAQSSMPTRQEVKTFVQQLKTNSTVTSLS